MQIFYQKEITKGHDITSLVRARGWDIHEIDSDDFVASSARVDAALESSDRSGPIFGFGTIRLASQFRRMELDKLGQGMVVDKSKLMWSSYSSQIPLEKQLNSFALMSTWNSLSDGPIKEALVSTFGESGIFIRPNSPFKPFTGFSTSWENYEYNLRSYKQLASIDPGEVCVLAPIQDVATVEWRFWVVAGQVATYAPYSWDGSHETHRDPPEGMVDDVVGIVADLEGYEDSLVIDMVRVDQRNLLVELNGLSTSGFYENMDVGALLDALPSMYGL